MPTDSKQQPPSPSAGGKKIEEGAPPNLFLTLEEARRIIWKRIQHGIWRDENQVITAIKVLQHIIKAQEETEKLSQLALPLSFPEEEKGGETTREVRYDYKH